MFTSLQQISDAYGITFYERDLKYTDNIIAIHNGNLEIDEQNPNLLNSLGIYHYSVTKDYVQMEKCYLKAIELGNVDAMTSLGIYHQAVSEDYDQMMKYYLMAIEHKSAGAMACLGSIIIILMITIKRKNII